MKKNVLTFFVLLIFIKAYAQDFTVENYSVVIYLHQDGYFDVVENYDLNFVVPKHGIYRDIQTSYDLLTLEGKQETRKIKISNVEVPNYKFETPPSFIQNLNSNFQIKIGDENKTIVGPQHYEIKYRVYNAFLHEKDAIHFYWNIKPDGWWAAFNSIDFIIHLPDGTSVSEDDVFVYSGNTGITTLCTDFNVIYNSETIIGKSKSNFVSYSGQNVTILIKLPTNSIIEIKPLWPFWSEYGWTLILGFFITLFYMIWKKFGKDDKVVATTSYYPPKDMDPAMVGFLINDSSDTSDLISLIPYWGSKGFLKMEEIPRKGWFGGADIKLVKCKDLPSDAPNYQQKIFIGLFGFADQRNPHASVLISTLQNKFYTTMSTASSQLTDNAQKYYETESRKIKKINLVFIILLAIILFPIFLFVWGFIAAISLVVIAIIIGFLNIAMIKKNEKGNRVFSELKGFKRFIKIAEENKLKMLLKENPGYFEATMAYALAFGLFDKWATKFDALNVQPPNWYSSASGTNFGMHNFSNSFSSAISSAKSTMVSSPSSSSSGGGGSSGGGFGGGGGGSW
jgi:uncharacterized membrane protein YgcG